MSILSPETKEFTYLLVLIKTYEQGGSVEEVLRPADSYRGS